MPRFFNRKQVRRTLQSAITVSIAVEAYNILSNPETACVQGFNLAVHALSLYSFGDRPSIALTAGCNLLDCSAIGLPCKTPC